MSSWVDQVSSLVDGDGPILTRLTEVFKILDENLQSTKQKLMPGMVMVHPSNRGSLGLNPYNVHRMSSYPFMGSCYYIYIYI